jgi:hypothetical protein
MEYQHNDPSHDRAPEDLSPEDEASWWFVEGEAAPPWRFSLDDPDQVLPVVHCLMQAIRTGTPIDMATVDRGHALPICPPFIPRMVTVFYNALDHRWMLSVVRDSDGMRINYGHVVEIDIPGQPGS